MIQVTFNVDGATVRPDPDELQEDLEQIFAGCVRLVDVIVLPDDSTKRWRPERQKEPGCPGGPACVCW